MMSREMVVSKWFWPSMIILSGLLAGSLSLTNSAFELRPLFALWFLLVCPGMAFVRLLPIKEMVVQWTLAIALSLALDALVGSILVYAHYWSPNMALLILIAASLAGVTLQVIPERKTAMKKLPISANSIEGNVQNRKTTNMVHFFSKNLVAAIRFRPHSSVSKSSIQSKTHGKILIVDRDETYSASLRTYMQAAGYDMLQASSGDIALSRIAQAKPNLVLMDLMLPGTHGWDTLHRLRGKSSVPIVILATKCDDADILHAFHLGADDFMTKPESFNGLESIVADVLSHSKTVRTTNDLMRSNELTINFVHKQVRVKGRKVILTDVEYRLLEALARYANRTIPISRLQAEVWGSSYEGSKQYFRKVIRSLRRKIEQDPSQPKHIITRRRYGYRLE